MGRLFRPGFAAFGVLMLCAATALAQKWAVPPGQEGFLRGVFEEMASLHADCVPAGASLERFEVVLRFSCVHGASGRSVVLRHPSTASDASTPRTERFLIASSDLPPDVTSALMSVLRRREGAFSWKELVPQGAVPQRREGTSLDRWMERRGIARSLGGNPGALWVGLLGALTFGLWLRHRPRLRTEETARVDSRPLQALGISLLALHAVVAVASACRLRFVNDDYDYLLRAARFPFDLDMGGRWVSVNLLFAAGHLARDAHAFFIAANLLAHALAVASAVLLLSRLGSPPAERWLAGGLMAFAPGQDLLLRWPSGFQHLSADAVLFAALYVTDRWLSSAERRERGDARFWLACLCFLLSLGVLIKYGVMVPALLTCAAFIALGHGASRDILGSRIGAVLLVSLVVVVTWGLSNPASLSSGDLGKAGFVGIPGNFLHLLGDERRASRWVWIACRAAVGLYLVSCMATALLAAREPRGPLGALSLGLGRLGSAFAERAPTIPAGTLLCAGFLLLAAPFAFVKLPVDYYGRLAFTAIAVVAARLLARSARHWSIALLVFSILAYGAWRDRPRPPENVKLWCYDNAERWVRAAGRALAGLPMPAVLDIAAGCPDAGPAANERAREELRSFHVMSDEGRGLLWVTGWSGVKLRWEAPLDGAAVRPEGSTIRLDYCGDLRFVATMDPDGPATLNPRTAGGAREAAPRR